jgi:hypothetical protein
MEELERKWHSVKLRENFMPAHNFMPTHGARVTQESGTLLFKYLPWVGDAQFTLCSSLSVYFILLLRQ